MPRTAAILAALLAPYSATALAVAIPWPVAAGGNGHYYQLVEPPAGMTWTEARDAAAASTLFGATGHLVTIANEDEWTFVTTTFPRDWTWLGLSDELEEGTFRWVTGEALTFTRWIPGEPNDAGGLEEYVFYQRSSGLNGAFGWNDFPNWPNVFTGALPIGYVVEFEPVPEPSSMNLIVAGTAVGLIWRKRHIFRRKFAWDSRIEPTRLQPPVAQLS